MMARATPGAHGMGCIKQAEDHRDIPLDLAGLPLQSLPASVDLRALFPAVHDQGSTNACTSYSTVDAFVYQRRKQKLRPDMPDPSHVFTYYLTRCREGTQGRDGGAAIRDAFKSVCTEGICQNKNWPDGVQQLELDPRSWWAANYRVYDPLPTLGGITISSDPMAVGKHHRCQTYRSVPLDLASIKASLANNFPIVMGFTVYASFLATGTDGKVPLPNPATEAITGSHAITLCGYDAQDRVLIRNSWGSSWGAGGYAWLPAGWWDLRISYDGWTHHSAAG